MNRITIKAQSENASKLLLFPKHQIQDFVTLTLIFIEQRGNLGSSGISQVVDLVVISSAVKDNNEFKKISQLYSRSALCPIRISLEEAMEVAPSL